MRSASSSGVLPASNGRYPFPLSYVNEEKDVAQLKQPRVRACLSCGGAGSQTTLSATRTASYRSEPVAAIGLFFIQERNSFADFKSLSRSATRNPAIP